MSEAGSVHENPLLVLRAYKMSSSVPTVPPRSSEEFHETIQAPCLSVITAGAESLAESVPGWKPFPDTNPALARLKERFRLGILSNIDNDLFAATARHFESAIGRFDFVITAEDVGSYKPGHGHFKRLLTTVVDDVSTHLHVAQSLFHDGVPAAELGIPFVWINRRGEVNETTARPLAELANLTIDETPQDVQAT